jgi:hypothetical protein
MLHQEVLSTIERYVRQRATGRPAAPVPWDESVLKKAGSAAHPVPASTQSGNSD